MYYNYARLSLMKRTYLRRAFSQEKKSLYACQCRKYFVLFIIPSTQSETGSRIGRWLPKPGGLRTKCLWPKGVVDGRPPCPSPSPQDLFRRYCS